jgi:hypothetical protein
MNLGSSRIFQYSNQTDSLDHLTVNINNGKDTDKRTCDPIYKPSFIAVNLFNPDFVLIQVHSTNNIQRRHDMSQIGIGWPVN